MADEEPSDSTLDAEEIGGVSAISFVANSRERLPVQSQENINPEELPEKEIGESESEVKEGGQGLEGDGQVLPTESGKRRKKSGSVTAHMQQELLRAKVAQAKADREVRRGKLGQTHLYLLETVANHLGLHLREAIDFLLDSPTYLEVMDSFLAKGGLKCIFFCYQDAEPPGIESGRPGVGPSRLKKTVKIRRLIVTDGTDTPLAGEVTYFIRVGSGHKIGLKNLVEETLFGVLDIKDSSEPGAVIDSVQGSLKDIYLQYLRGNESWVAGVDPEKAEAARLKFLSSVEHFSDFLGESKFDISSRLDLRTLRNIDDLASMLRSSEDVVIISKMPEMVAQVEQIVTLWCKNIEKVLAVSISMRKEAEEMGPLAETAYWRNLMAKMSFILGQINEWTIVSFIQILINVKSKVLKRWRSVETRVNDQFHEAKDNVKYMEALEKFCYPLYQCDPPGMIEHVPSLIYTIRLIHTSSRYYNTCEKVTALMVKVSNQMIRACRRFITRDGTETIWGQDKRSLVGKLKKCIELYQTYKSCFDSTKTELAKDPEGKQFTFSENHIFGRFEKFCERLDKIITLVEIFDMYRFVHESNIRGIGFISNQLRSIQRELEEKTTLNDPLEFREDFDKDYAEIRAQVDRVQMALEKFMDDSIDACPTALHGLELLERFKNLRNRCLDIEAKEWYLFQFYHNEIQMIKSIYDCEKNDTPIPRGFPPFAGKLAWCRHLYRRLERPMKIFKERTSVLDRDEARPTVKLYNSVAKKLIFFEIIFHDGWVKQCNAIYDSLEAPLLTLRGTIRQELVLNFDPFFRQIIEETEIIRKLDLEVPDVAQIAYFKQDKLLGTYEQMKGLLERFVAIKAHAPPDLTLLIRPMIKRVEKSFMPGIANINWTSFKCEEYFGTIEENLQELEQLIHTANEIIRVRINQYVYDLAHTIMIDLPEEVPSTVEEYMDRVRKYSALVGKDLEYKSRACETAVIELINILLASTEINAPEEVLYSWMNTNLFQISKEDSKGRLRKKFSQIEELVIDINHAQREELAHIHEECRHVFGFYSQKCIEALQKATKNALESLRKRTEEPQRLKRRQKEEAASVPIFLADLILAIPTINIRPHLVEIQEVLNRSIQITFDSALKTVVIWGQSRRSSFDVNAQDAFYKDPAKEAEELANAMYPRLQTHQQLVLASMPLENVNAKLRNVYRLVMDQKDIGKLNLMLQSCVLHVRTQLSFWVSRYLNYSFLWRESRDQVIGSLVTRPDLVITEIEALWKKYCDTEEEIRAFPPYHRMGPLLVTTELLKESLVEEIDGWKSVLCIKLHEYYRDQATNLGGFIEERLKDLSSPMKDMQGIHFLMRVLERIRSHSDDEDAKIKPIEEAYRFLQSKKHRMSEDDVERAFELGGEFQKLLDKAKEVELEIGNVQGGHKKMLLEAIAQFEIDLANFLKRYARVGPNIDGIRHEEAADRVFLFQDQFDQLSEREHTYREGQLLFGMTPKVYPDLSRVRKELIILQRVYGLYTDVMHTLNGYAETLLREVNKLFIDRIISECDAFEERCNALPDSLKDWSAYKELRERMEEFYEVLPMIDLVEERAIEERDWYLLEELVGIQLKGAPEKDVPLKIGHLWEAKRRVDRGGTSISTMTLASRDSRMAQSH